jgi:hypothetical protein
MQFDVRREPGEAYTLSVEILDIRGMVTNPSRQPLPK